MCIRDRPKTAPTRGDVRHGFVYERAPHITLKSIANNAEIDVIWEKWQAMLEPLRGRLSVASGQQKTFEEWEIPRERPKGWPPATDHLLTEFWKARIARQKEIDASIAAKAEFEYLYDRPYLDNSRIRVAGPFTVESLSPHRTLAVDWNDELIDILEASAGHRTAPDKDDAVTDFAQMVLENLKAAGVQQAHKEDRIAFTSLVGWPGDFICAEGVFMEGDKEKRAGIFIGPEFGTVSRPDLVAAAREAGDARFDVLIACAFNYDAHSAEFDKLGRVPVLKARMNPDLHMGTDLKATGAGNLFVIFGEPDIEVVSGRWLVTSGGRTVVCHERLAKLPGLASLEEINRLGGSDLSRFKRLAAGRGQLGRAHKKTVVYEWPAGVPLPENYIDGHAEFIEGDEDFRYDPDYVPIRWRDPTHKDREISPASGGGERVAGGGGDASGHRAATGNPGVLGDRAPAGSSGEDRPHALRPDEVAAIESLRAADFPLQLTTDHLAQVTVFGVDVFRPQTGEVFSEGTDGIALWMLDTDYNEESFFVRHAYFLGANDPYKALKTTLRAEIDEEAWQSLHSDTSRPFTKPKSGRIAVKVINHLGDEVMKVLGVG